MGYQTDWIGYLQIDPPLGPRQRSLINRVSGSLFVEAPAGGLRVAVVEDDALRDLMASAPRGWSNWTVCTQGCCLSYDGGDKANYMLPWLVFLIDTFLAVEPADDGPDGTRCDHLLTGMVVGSRRDTRELCSITVRDNDVQVELLWPGNPSWSDYPALAYQWELDAFRDWVVERRGGRPSPG